MTMLLTARAPASPASPRSVTMERDKMGRPPKNPEDRATARIEFVCTKQEKELAEKAALRAGKKLSAWLRDQMNRAVNSTSPQKRR